MRKKFPELVYLAAPTPDFPLQPQPCTVHARSVRGAPGLIKGSLQLCPLIDRSLSSLFPCPPATLLHIGNEHAMLELTDVQLPKRMDDGGLGHPAVAMAYAGTWDARLPNQGPTVRLNLRDEVAEADADPFLAPQTRN